MLNMLVFFIFLIFYFLEFRISAPDGKGTTQDKMRLYLIYLLAGNISRADIEACETSLSGI